MRKKGLPEAIIRAVINIYHGAKTKVGVGSESSEGFLLQFLVHIKDLCCRQCFMQLWWM